MSVQRDLPWELDSSLETVGRTDLGGTVGAVGKPNFGSHFRVFAEDDGSKRLVGTSFEEDLRQGKLTFFEYNERMELLYRTTAELPVCHPYKVHLRGMHTALILLAAQRPICHRSA